MDIQFLGTGAGQPSKARNVSSLALKLLDEINEVWLFDCGEGTPKSYSGNHDTTTEGQQNLYHPLARRPYLRIAWIPL